MNKEIFGGFIADLRRVAGMTQKQVADRLHVTDRAVSKWERGLSYPDVTLMEPLAVVLGVGVGGSFDKVAYLAKKALLRPLDVPNPDPYYADLEKELLTAINELGIGPQGFGGRTTCLGLAIEQMPTHVAGLPVAVNVSCHVTRRASAAL